MAYSVLHFRARPDDDSDGPPMHGHTMLEIVWTAIPAVLVTAISIVSAIVLAQNSRAGSNPLVVKVDGAAVRLVVQVPERQDLRLPDASARQAREARHHRERRHPFVLGARVLAEAGRACRASTTRSSSRRRALGTFPVICTELCGLGHALMRSHVESSRPPSSPRS